MSDNPDRIQSMPDASAQPEIGNGEDFRRLAEALPEGILIHNDGIILYANPETAAIFGVETPQSLTGIPLTTFFSPDVWKRVQQSVAAMETSERGGCPAELTLVRPDDKEATLETVTTSTHFMGAPSLCTLLRDISQRKQNDDHIRRLANYDYLTGLPNRTLFLDRLNREMIRARRQKTRVALMFIDLDRFKWVNDTLGHAAGDKLLKEVSQRLQKSLRQSDTVARLGGDEFTAILPDIAKGPFAERVAGEVLIQLATPFILEGQEAFISGSIGITVYPDDADTLDHLLQNADTAMYRAKHDGRNAYRFFTPDMHAEAQERMELEKDLHHALERNELTIHYQPIVHLETGKLMGAESFLRWNHPRRGNISPNVFVRLAEEIGLISEITAWTIRTACSQAQKWRQRPGNEGFFISVNLSCTRCRELSTDDKIPAILRDTGLPPASLYLEITENILSEDEEKAMLMLKQLVHLGVNLWLDDFGTGYSSLSVLKRLPVSGIKIDRAFVPDVNSDPETVVLVEAIMSLAKSLNRKVIGEGVEMASQAAFLRKGGCIMGQGYLFSKPLPAEAFEAELGKCYKV